MFSGEKNQLDDVNKIKKKKKKKTFNFGKIELS